MKEDEYEKGDRRVFLVNPPYENPWRTRGDYNQEQEEARERHQMLLQQHQAFLDQQEGFAKTLLWSKVMSVATLVIAVGTLWMAYNTTQASREDTPPQTQQIESKPDTSKIQESKGTDKH